MLMNSIVSLDLVGLLPVSRNPIIDNIVLSCTRNFLFLEIFNLQIGKQSIVYLRQGFIKTFLGSCPNPCAKVGGGEGKRARNGEGAGAGLSGSSSICARAQ